LTENNECQHVTNKHSAEIAATTSTMSMLTRGLSLRLTSQFCRGSHTPFRPLFTTVGRSPARSGVFATAIVLSTGLFAVYYFDARSSLHRYFLTPLLRHALDAETGHKVAVKVLKSGLGPRDPLPDDQRLETRVRISGLWYMIPTKYYTALGPGHLEPCWIGCWFRQGWRGC
jgi:hypothetical protein